MNVVLEGPDGSGKSTLAARLSDVLWMRVQQGSGPPRAPGEIEERSRTYLKMHGVIFDRHPCVSQVIYGAIRRQEPSAELIELVGQFSSRTDHLIVYCRSTSASRHVVKPGESPDHIAAVNEQYGRIVELYDLWALERAHMIYRIGDDVDRIADAIAAVGA